jgi:hypothetical protein
VSVERAIAFGCSRIVRLTAEPAQRPSRSSPTPKERP